MQFLYSTHPLESLSEHELDGPRNKRYVQWYLGLRTAQLMNYLDHEHFISGNEYSDLRIIFLECEFAGSGCGRTW